jgi:hypothetical protein
MMRRSMYSKLPDHAPPIIEILWDKGALMIEAKAGTLDIKAIGPMFQQVLVEITQAIKAGQANGIKKSHGEKGGAGSGTAQADSGVEPGGSGT